MNTSPSVEKAPWYRALFRWFDSEATDRDQFIEKHSIEWLRVVPFGLVHLACGAIYWVGWSPIAVGVALGAYAIRMFAITGFYHRYFSHRTFKTSRLFQLVFAILGNSALQRGPLWWAAHHRHHHRYADQDKDPHSPHQHGFLWSHILWITSRKNFSTDMRVIRDLLRYPELRFLNRFDFLVPIALAVGMYFLGESLTVYGTNGWQMLIWGFFVSTIVLFHATCTINSLSHQFGSRRFETNEHSRNNPLLALITFGEGWHNNHHFAPGACRQGFFWWEIDLTYIGLRLLSYLGIIWDLKPVPDRAYQRAKETA